MQIFCKHNTIPEKKTESHFLSIRVLRFHFILTVARHKISIAYFSFNLSRHSLVPENFTFRSNYPYRDSFLKIPHQV